MTEKALPASETSSEPEKSGIRRRIVRLPSVPKAPSGINRKGADKNPHDPEGVLKEDAFKLTGSAVLKLTSLEMKLKKDLRKAKNEKLKESIQEKLDQCEDLARMLNLHIKDLIEQDANISQESRPLFNYDQDLYQKIVEAQQKEQAAIKLKVHPGLTPLLREINEFIKSVETPEDQSKSISRAA